MIDLMAFIFFLSLNFYLFFFSLFTPIIIFNVNSFQKYQSDYLGFFLMFEKNISLKRTNREHNDFLLSLFRNMIESDNQFIILFFILFFFLHANILSRRLLSGQLLSVVQRQMIRFDVRNERPSNSVDDRPEPGRSERLKSLVGWSLVIFIIIIAIENSRYRSIVSIMML